MTSSAPVDKGGGWLRRVNLEAGSGPAGLTEGLDRRTRRLATEAMRTEQQLALARWQLQGERCHHYGGHQRLGTPAVGPTNNPPLGDYTRLHAVRTLGCCGVRG